MSNKTGNDQDRNQYLDKGESRILDVFSSIIFPHLRNWKVKIQYFNYFIHSWMTLAMGQQPAMWLAINSIVSLKVIFLVTLKVHREIKGCTRTENKSPMNPRCEPTLAQRVPGIIYLSHLVSVDTQQMHCGSKQNWLWSSRFWHSSLKDRRGCVFTLSTYVIILSWKNT